MPIGTSDGQSYGDELEMLVATHWPEKWAQFAKPGNVEDRRNEPTPELDPTRESGYLESDNQETINEQTDLGIEAGVNDLDMQYVQNWNGMREVQTAHDPLAELIKKLPKDDEIRSMLDKMEKAPTM